MKNNILVPSKVVCPHCGGNDLRYYKEAFGGHDYYYCEKTYNLVVWNGEFVMPYQGEAYPNRDKTITLAHL
jgi:hypothetical protein